MLRGASIEVRWPIDADAIAGDHGHAGEGERALGEPITLAQRRGATRGDLPALPRRDTEEIAPSVYSLGMRPARGSQKDTPLGTRPPRDPPQTTARGSPPQRPNGASERRTTTRRSPKCAASMLACERARGTQESR